MRSKLEMLSLILQTAQADPCIQAVYMNGSRVNPNVKQDLFQDYDVVYVVEDIKPYREDKKWIDCFGKRLYMQYPEENLGDTQDVDRCYGWLIQFADGNRLDLHVQTLDYAKEAIMKDSLSEILLDKNNCLPAIKKPSDINYWVKKPTEEMFLFTCNEFWWCLNNAVKGAWRKEIPYVQEVMNTLLRPQLLTILSWEIGVNTNFTVNIGKYGKWMDRWLTAEDWEAYCHTYANYQIDEIWVAMDRMSTLLDLKAKSVARELNFNYDEEEAKASCEFMRYVKALPQDAKEIY